MQRDIKDRQATREVVVESNNQQWLASLMCFPKAYAIGSTTNLHALVQLLVGC
jgi:hypothetical protein